MADTGATDQLGRAQFTASLTAATKWVVHVQTERDHGVDATVELTDIDGKPDGGRVALQLKSGQSYFTRIEKNADGEVVGWWRPVPNKHRDYWIGHPMPVYIVLVNTATGEWYFQRLTAETCISTGKNYKVLVPAIQQVDTAAARWRQDAETFRALTQQGHVTLSRLLPPTAARELCRLAAVDSGLADLIAAMLTSGEAELSAELLLGARGSWLKAAPSHAYTAVGAYASEHDLRTLATDAYETAASACSDDTERAGVLLAIAGSCAAGVDEARSIALLERAEATGSVIGTRRAALTRTVADTAALAAFAPDDWRDVTDPGLASHAALVSALHHQHHDRLASAVTQVRRSLDFTPQATAAMLLLADLLMLRASTSQAQAGDAAAALEVTRRARQQRQQWNGPTLNLLALELKALTILSRHDEALEVISTFLGDDRHRTEIMSDEPTTTMVADIVIHSGRTDLIEKLSASLELGSLAYDALTFRHALDENSERVDDWQQRGSDLIDRAVAAGDPRLATGLIAALASREVDVTQEFDKLAAAELLPPRQLLILKTQMAAADDLEAALPELRTAAHQSLGAAEVLLASLMHHGRIDQAKIELESLARHHSKATLAPIVVAGLRRAGRADEAAELARDGLAAGTLEGRDRAGLVRVAIEAAAANNEWDRVDTLARDELNRLAGLNVAALRDHIEDYIWVRLAALTRLRRHGDAADLLATAHVTPDNTQHLQTWVQVTGYRGFDTDDVNTFLTCLEKAKPTPELTGHLLRIVWSSHTMVTAARRNAEKAVQTGSGSSSDGSDEHDEERSDDQEKSLSAEAQAGRALYAALEKHRETHGEIPGVIARQVEQSDAGIQELVDDLGTQLREQAERLNDARRLVMDGAPLGLLAAINNRPYARAVIGRVIGYLPAITTNENDFDAEVEAAADTLGKHVVVEASSLHVLGSLNKPGLSGHFTELLLSERSRDDITECLLASRSDRASAGHMGYDLVQGRMTMSDGPDPDTELLIAAAERLEEHAIRCTVRKVESTITPTEPENDADGYTEGDASDTFAPWLDAVELAAAGNLSLWSDDVGLRTLARSRGVPAFSTAALLEALVYGEQLADAEVPVLRAALIRCGVADLDVTDDELLSMIGEAAVIRDSDPVRTRAIITGVVMKLSRPSFAQGKQTPLTSVRTLIHAAAEHDQSWAESFAYQALNGLATASVPTDAILEGAVILSLGGQPPFEAVRTARYLELARQVLIARNDDDPISTFPDILDVALGGLPEQVQLKAAVLEALLPATPQPEMAGTPGEDATDRPDDQR